MTTVMITGANRGIGLEFVKQYLAEGCDVIACCRVPEQAKELQALDQKYPGRITRVPLDVLEKEQIRDLKHRLQGRAIDILINNAGVYGPRGAHFGRLNRKTWVQVLRINTVAPLLIVQNLIENIEKGQLRIIANISSKMGSITDNTSGSAYIYRSSKAALNAAMKSLAIDLKPRGIKVVLLHPGWVKTDMGGPDALTPVGESVKGMRHVINTLTPQQSGEFIGFDGEKIPW